MKTEIVEAEKVVEIKKKEYRSAVDRLALKSQEIDDIKKRLQIFEVTVSQKEGILDNVGLKKRGIFSMIAKGETAIDDADRISAEEDRARKSLKNAQEVAEACRHDYALAEKEIPGLRQLVTAARRAVIESLFDLERSRCLEVRENVIRAVSLMGLLGRGSTASFFADIFGSLSLQEIHPIQQEFNREFTDI